VTPAATREYRYGWTRHFGVSAQDFGEWLYELSDRSAEGIVRAARHPKCLAHRLFEWNDGTAARLYRLQQARELVASLTVEIVTPERKREYVRAFIGSSDRTRYSIICEATSDELDTAERRCISEMNRMRDRWRGIQLARGVVSAIDAVRAQVARRGGERKVTKSRTK
jgi:hypothetical protein